MQSSRATLHSFIGAAMAAALGSAIPAAAQSPSPPGVIADNDSIFIDGSTFKVTPGKAKAEVAGQVKALGARALGPGAIIFRSGDKLYILDAPLSVAAREAPGGNLYVGADPARTNRIRIEYAPPQTSEYQKLRDMLMEHRALEMLQEIFSPLRLPVDLLIKTKECGMSNAWYQTVDSVPTVTVCYEFLQEIMQGAPTETTDEGISRVDAIMGQFLFWTTHEMGHAVFDIFQIPVFGREEDAADQVAGYVLLQFGHDQARRLVKGAAYAGHKLVEMIQKNPDVTKPLTKFSSNHGLPEQRFFNLLCMAYGADPVTFAGVVDKGYLPQTRAKHCEDEFQNFKRAWVGEIRPHIDLPLARSVLDMAWLPPPQAQALQK